MRPTLLTAVLLVLVSVPAVVMGCGNGPSRGSAGADRDDTPVKAATVQPPVRVGRTPVAVAVTESAVWVLDQGDGRLREVDPATGRPGDSAVRVGSSPLALAAGEGALWVLDGRTGVTRIDPATGRPSGKAVPVADPNGIVAGAGGVWVSSRQARTVTRIDPRTLRADRPIRVGAGPADLAVSGGAVWVAEADAGTVRRVDARTFEVGRPIEVAEEQVLALTADAGAVYAAVSRTRLNDELAVVEIDPRKGEVTGKAIPITGGVPLRLAAGHGSLWATDVGSTLPGTTGRPSGLLRVLLQGERGATRVAPVPGRPSAVATGPDAVWVTDSTRGTLRRIDVR